MAKVDPSRNIPTGSSQSQDWIEWHKALRKTFGKKEANAIWVFAWSKRGGIDSAANTGDLNSYLKTQDIDIDRSTLAEAAESFGDFADSFMSIGKWATIITVGVGTLILIKILMSIMKNPKKSVGSAASFTPVGKGAKMAKGAKAAKFLK
jgi:hypothetical protein